MTKKNIILEELKELQIQLPEASVPFEDVPNGYFESLNDGIFAEIRLDPFRSTLSHSAVFAVPADYFISLHTNVMNIVSKNSFIDSLPPLAPYEVPANYFERSVSEIVINSQTANFLESLPTQTPYQLPVNYFDHLTDEIISKSSNALKISPLSATSTFYRKLSIAASLFIILSISFLLMFHNSKDIGVENQLAHISDAEINNYMLAHSYEFENELSFQTVDESKIDFNNLENDIYNSYFEDISEEEIKNFL